MEAKEIEVKADSLNEARRLLKSRIPKNLDLLSEDVVSDGEPKTFRVVSDTTETAFSQARSKVPQGAKLLKEEMITTPNDETIVVVAFNEEEARADAERQVGERASVLSVTLTAKGSRGILGFRKMLNTYEVQIHNHAIVEMTYKVWAIIRAKIGKGLRCELCTNLVEQIYPMQLAELGGIYREMKLCEKCCFAAAIRIAHNKGNRFGWEK